MNVKGVVATLLVLAICHSASPPCTSEASGDVHVHHPAGGSFDLKGLHDTCLNMFQAANVSINTLFTYAFFLLAPEDPRSQQVVEVAGSFQTESYSTFKLALDGAVAFVRVQFGAKHPTPHVMVTDAISGSSLIDLSLGVEDGVLTLGSLQIEVSTAAQGAAAAALVLIMTTNDWKFNVALGTYRTASDGVRHPRIDVSVAALTDPLGMHVAAHGIIGQGFDGMNIEGKKDDYIPNVTGLFTTSAQGEGAIQGTVHDYITEPFSTEFKFSRFLAEAAPPRDTGSLNAASMQFHAAMLGATADTVEAGPAGRRLDVCQPTKLPKADDVVAPTNAPTKEPTEAPTDAPSTAPSDAPSTAPSDACAVPLSLSNGCPCTASSFCVSGFCSGGFCDST